MMNWKSAKTILIVFFICSNLFLLTTIILSTEKTSIITDDIRTSTVMILKNNGIEINPDVIPRKIKNAPILEAENVIDDQEKFAEKLIGPIIEQQGDIYKGKDAHIKISGDYFELIPAIPSHTELTKKINPENALQVASSILKIYGFSDDAELSLEINDDMYIVQSTKKDDDMCDFSSRLELKMSEAGITKLSGRWFLKKKEVSPLPTLKSVTSVLIDYISLNDRTIGDEKIVQLDFGYMLSEQDNEYHNEATLIPAWQITLSNNRKYVLSAIDTQINE